jgi:sodium-dependent dicarboxylate transporter 2/3/5
MMPIASPTQAIVFGSGHVKIKQMIKAGILFNLLGIIVVTGVFYILAKFVFGIEI